MESHFTDTMQELSTTIHGVAEACIAAISGLHILPNFPLEVAFEDDSWKDEVRIDVKHHILILVCIMAHKCSVNMYPLNSQSNIGTQSNQSSLMHESN